VELLEVDLDNEAEFDQGRVMVVVGAVVVSDFGEENREVVAEAGG
jgi:hypothetical protein